MCLAVSSEPRQIKKVPYLLRRITISSLLAVCAFGLVAGANAAPAITVYLSAPDVVVAPAGFTGLLTETFSGLTTGIKTTDYVSPTVGTYSGGPFNILADDDFGSGAGNYFGIGSRSNSTVPVDLTFVTPIAYFGVSYTAGDNVNGFSFYDSNNVFLARFSSANLVSFLNSGAGQITATNGAQYNTSDYFGKPVTGQNNGQPYAFVNFFFTGGTVKRIRFDNTNTTNGFESDNHTISTTAQNPNGTPLVFVSNVAVVPETGTLALALAGVSMLGTVIARRRK